MLCDRAAGPRPGAHLRARLALHAAGRAGRRRRAPSTSTTRRCAARARDLTLVTYGGTLPQGARRRRDAGRARASRPRSSTCARCGRSTTRPSIASVRAHPPAVVVDEGWRTGSLAAEVSARITEQGFYDLDAPVERVCSAEVPMPYATAPGGGRAARSRPDRRRGPRGGGREWPSSRCPSLGADMDEGTVLEWLVQPGDEVHRGDVDRGRRHRQGGHRGRVLRRRRRGRAAGRPGTPGRGRHPAGHDRHRVRPIRTRAGAAAARPRRRARRARSPRTGHRRRRGRDRARPDARSPAPAWPRRRQAGRRGRVARTPDGWRPSSGSTSPRSRHRGRRSGPGRDVRVPRRSARAARRTGQPRRRRPCRRPCRAAAAPGSGPATRTGRPIAALMAGPSGRSRTTTSPPPSTWRAAELAAASATATVTVAERIVPAALLLKAAALAAARLPGAERLLER